MNGLILLTLLQKQQFESAKTNFKGGKKLTLNSCKMYLLSVIPRNTGKVGCRTL